MEEPHDYLFLFPLLPKPGVSRAWAQAQGRRKWASFRLSWAELLPLGARSGSICLSALPPAGWEGARGPCAFPHPGSPAVPRGQAAHPLQVARGLLLPPPASCPPSTRGLC